MNDGSLGLFGKFADSDPAAFARSTLGLVGDRFAAHWLAFADSGFSDSTEGRSSYLHTRQLFDAGPVALRDIVFDWPNWACTPHEVPGPNAIRVSAYLTDGSRQNHQILWSGSERVSIAPGDTATNDPLDVTIEPGSLWSLTVSITAATPRGAYPCNSLLTEQPGEGCFVAGLEISDSNNMLADARNPLPDAILVSVPALPVYAPVAMRGETGRQVTRILVLGDSIADGFADDVLRFPGFIRRALTNRYPLLALSAAGDTITFLSMAAIYRARLIARCGATDCIYQLGTNDLAGGFDFVQLRATTLAAWEWFAARGIAIHACTLMPRTTSADGFVTIEQQTAVKSELERLAYNRWIRSGADGRIASCIDIAASVEIAPDAGAWKVIGGPWTVDGTHPSPVGYAAAAAAIDTARFRHW